MRHDYAELHLHTAFSFLDGASLPEELIAHASDLGYRALAVTDHDGLYGAMEFVRLARAAGIQPITGAELTLDDGSHLTLLAETVAGYANLCRLITAAHRDPAGDGLPERVPRLDPALLPAHARGLILLTGCRQGQLARLVDAGCFPEAEALLRRYIDWFGPEQVVVELQQNLVYGDTRRVDLLVQLAGRLGLRYAATGDVHYHQRERHRLQDVLVAIRNRATLDSSHRQRRANSEFFLKSADEMAALFARYPLALATTLDIAGRCASFDLTRDLAYTFPDYPTGPGETPDDVLARVCREALAARYPDDREAAGARLSEELALIARHGLAGFFLLYRDLLQLAKEVAAEVRGRDTPRGAFDLPPGRGRGSSVSSIVCYLIGLSHVDPLAHGLFLGRFLNEELRSVPDIDLDFPRDIRERLIERVYEVYGADHAALVCAFSTYRLRSAVRDVGKALGLPLPDLDKIAKLSESRSARSLGEELGRIPAYATRKDAPPWTYLIELSEQLAGFPRHVTQHVGGMIVSSKPLVDLVPIQPAAMDGRFICQWDKDSCDDARFIKIDFLALGMLSLAEECLELIVTSGKPAVDLSRIDFADPAVFDMICAGDTIGVFQIESRAQIQTLPRTLPRSLEDLVVQVAIIRPGPITGGAVNPYIRNRQRLLRNPTFRPACDHPLLEPVLRETLGVILYQEQVLEVAMVLAGFTAGQAESLRRAMSRKRSREAMAHFWVQFRDGAREREVAPRVAKDVFRKLLGFAEYGFPKSHSVAFAVLAYQSAWLRRYHPAEFTCALFNNQPMGFYPPHVLTNDAKRHGVRVLPPDVNRSGARCTVEGNAVRIGFGYVDGVGEDAARLIERERDLAGRYRSLADFVRRMPLKREAIENLIAVGAFDSFGLGRREALWQLGLFIPARGFGRPAAGSPAEPGRQQPLALPVDRDMVELRPMSPWEQMAADYDTLGLSPRYHPLGLLRPHLPEEIVTTEDLAAIRDGTHIQVAGMVVCRQRPHTAKGITFLLLEDERGLVNVIVYPALYEEQRLLVRGEPFLVVEGRLQQREGTINIVAEHLQTLDDAHRMFSPAPDQSAQQPASDPRAFAPAAHNFH
ncbi:DNA polymerase III subunit alpha [Nitrolancea hollandica]|uniref:DNA polymerase III subunit alpha n=1 Tax=Nitrolancea hollandica Lb TaxID=1129897 RepID=I4EHQ9_9BACT|nr:error-prone DNA polymerase [Nitrolancea hollandica]CCF84221.1 DNA polymerase III, alpha subunit [Nitrolancea hollandica Lb]